LLTRAWRLIFVVSPTTTVTNLRSSILTPQDLASRLRAEKRFHIQRALSESCYWGRAIERNQKKPSDQRWIETFSKGSATIDDVKEFFPTYQIHRAPWQFETVAIQVNGLHDDKDWTPTSGIQALAKSLPKALENSKDGKALQDGHRISAASKVAMFARPGDDVFMWDRLANVAVGVRVAARNTVAKAIKYNVKGPNGYDVFHRHCMRELKAELEVVEFIAAVDEFMDFTAFTRSGREPEQLAGRRYFERRLFDKLLVCEGVRIEELRAAGREFDRC
jgi:hypothetical protein